MNIELSNVTCKYGSHVVIDSLSTCFEEGKITMILGSNGCGKTTLLKHLVDNSESLFGKSSSNQIAFVPQETLGSLNLTVRDVLALGRYDKSKFFGGETANDRALIDEISKEFGLEDFLNRNIDTLSGGERQRVFIARALVQNAPWTLLDEPTANLDVKYVDTVMRIIKAHKDNSHSFIMVVHDINLASLHADSVLLMKNGHVVSSGEPSKALTIENLEKAYDISFIAAEVEGQRVFINPVK